MQRYEKWLSDSRAKHWGEGWILLLSFLVPLGCAAPSPESESSIEPTPLPLVPVAQVAHKAIDESSGLVWFAGHYWTHNDSGDSARLFRSSDLSFRSTEIFSFPEAESFDWEEVALFRDGILACDIGDNKRQRDHLSLYHVVLDSAETVRLADTFHIQYPDGKHDAEACFSADGVLYVIGKDRGEGTGVYRWTDLESSPEIQMGERVGTLLFSPREQITAADFDPKTGRVYLLSYSAILVYSIDHLDGAPLGETRIWARQAESLCFVGDALVFGNEQRDMFRIPIDMESDVRGSIGLPDNALPQLRSAKWPVENTWETLPLQKSLESERLEWRKDGPAWMLRGTLAVPEGLTLSQYDGLALGSALCFSFSTEKDPPVAHSGAETHLAVVQTADGTELWRVELMRPGAGDFAVERVSTGSGQAENGQWIWEIEVPAEVVAELTAEDQSRFDIHGLQLREENEDVYFSAPGSYALERPYAWGHLSRR